MRTTLSDRISAILPSGETRSLITQTSFRDFKNCRRLDYYKSEEGIVPLEEKAETLRLGGMVHQALAGWYSGIEAKLESKNEDLLIQVQAIFEAYKKRWNPEPFHVVSVEPVFWGEVLNPDTGFPSRTHVFAGRADLIVEDNEGLWLVEHKTVSQTIDQSYLERLWTDEQVALYIAYLENGEKFQGVIYNVLGKSRLKRLEPNSRRQSQESSEEYRTRLMTWYEEEDRFHRERLYVSRDQIRELKQDLWDITQERLACRKSGRWYQNRDHCFNWGHPCSYLSLCRSGNNLTIKENLYRRQEPHEELRGSATE